ncbi:hypothetical protein [Enterococcus sp. UD-01]|uniref:hypothetical protein n=1 Tax=Enterococcus sp. UD-01 TaxID=3373911 RepID=UPI0038332AC5
MKRIERNLGSFILEYKDQKEQEEAESNFEQLKKITLNKLDNYDERAILSKEFKRLNDYD